MIGGVLVLRPEPGNADTAARLAAAGVDVLRQPLFAVAPVAWTPPAARAFDALLLTSANAVRHAGPGLGALAGLPVLAVGETTAVAAREAGLDVALTGDRDAATLVAAARARGFARLLHLAGRDRVAAADVAAVTVYRSEALAVPAGVSQAWLDRAALLHSARAGRRFARLIARDGLDRRRIAIAALSAAVLAAAGCGWARAAVAPVPTDAALVACAAALIDPRRDGVDKQAR